MIRAVLDTNVLVSAVLSPRGMPFQLTVAWDEGRFLLLTSDALLRELRHTLGYEHLQIRHGLEDSALDALISRYRTYATLLSPTTPVQVIAEDPTDNAVLECALEGAAQYIVSGDRHLVNLGSFQGIPILRPTEFMMVLAQHTPGTTNENV
jgi:putative PIN family toxin of toxin-antitoxin system